MPCRRSARARARACTAMHRRSTSKSRVRRTPPDPSSFIGELLTLLGARNIVTADLGSVPDAQPGIRGAPRPGRHLRLSGGGCAAWRIDPAGIGFAPSANTACAPSRPRCATPSCGRGRASPKACRPSPTAWRGNTREHAAPRGRGSRRAKRFALRRLATPRHVARLLHRRHAAADCARPAGRHHESRRLAEVAALSGCAFLGGALADPPAAHRGRVVRRRLARTRGRGRAGRVPQSPGRSVPARHRVRRRARRDGLPDGRGRIDRRSRLDGSDRDHRRRLHRRLRGDPAHRDAVARRAADREPAAVRAS